IDADTGVSHLCDLLPCTDALAGLGTDRAEVRVEREKRTVSPVVMNDHITTVIDRPRGTAHINDRPVRDRSHLVERLARRVAPDRANVYPLVEPGQDDAAGSALLIAGEPIRSPAPGLGQHSLEVPIRVHVELRGIIGEYRVILR